TVHLREDRRHIQERDLRLLRQVVRGKLNLEMAPVEEMRRIAIEVRPQQATLVPERRQEVTTEGGLDAAELRAPLKEFITPLREGGIQVSLFIDPDPRQVDAAAELGADYVELNTARYAEARTGEGRAREARTVGETAKGASRLGLGVHAGHGLTYLNVEAIAAIPELEELNIGHSIVSHGVFVGFERAVREMAALVVNPRP
ncbi:MAG: pyridoxine 5'-phosphate synthase, partial [Nitrospinota bacterium]